MAPIKRKEGPAGTRAPASANKKVKLANDEHSTKQKKSTDLKSSAAREGSKGSSDTKTAFAKATAVSLLKKEEPSFPRGGASVLTPLEQKQIQVQANKDVLFEQRTGQKAGNAYDDESDFDVQASENGEEEKKGTKPGRSSRAKYKKGKALEEKDRTGLRIEGLSYKVGETSCWSAECADSSNSGLSLAR